MDRAMIEERLEQFRLQHAAATERLKALDAQIAEVKRTQLRGYSGRSGYWRRCCRSRPRAEAGHITVLVVGNISAIISLLRCGFGGACLSGGLGMGGIVRDRYGRIGGEDAMLAAGPAGAQAVAAAQTAYLGAAAGNSREDRGAGIGPMAPHLRDGTGAATKSWRADETRSSYGFSLQEGSDRAHADFGLSAYARRAAFRCRSRVVRDARHYAGARLSFEASDHVEMGFAWLRRVRGRGFTSLPGGNRGIKPGPRPICTFRF